VKYIRVAAYAQILGAAIFLLLFLAAAIIYGNYSPVSNYLSDLGVGKTAAFFNSGVIIAGLVGIFFAYELTKLFKNRGRIGGVLAAIAFLFLALVGIFTEESPLHLFVASIFFVLAAVSIIMIGIEMKNKMIIVLGIVPLLLLISLTSIVEHIAVFSVIVAELIISLHVLRR
jgi:hypothetical membrane protein